MPKQQLMARYKGDFPAGLVGNLVFYSVNGKRLVKSNNTDVRQTKATRASAKTFGKIKGISAGLRSGLAEKLPSYKTKPVMFAMDEAVRAWYTQSFPTAKGVITGLHQFSSLHLNKEASPFLQSWLGDLPVAEWGPGKLKIQFPAMDLSRILLPKHTSTISYELVVCSCNTSAPRYYTLHQSGPVEKKLTGTSLRSFEIDMDLTINYAHLLLAFLCLRFKAGSKWVEDEKWKPILVVGSCYKP